MARVLVVEDSPANMMLALTLLESAQHLVLQAEHALLGIELARRELPDLILMDIQMPGMDGMQAMRILKDDPATRAIPVIALTAFAMKGDRERLLAAGFDSYIEKPIDYLAFLEQVNAFTARE
jgi:two-component system, cell cycle response regulator DivK